MPAFRPGELSQWIGQLWKNGMPEGLVTGVTQDTRALKPGHLYVAIRGERFDGHDFVDEAFAKGAAGALVRYGFDQTQGPVLQVPDTIKGLQDFARGYRKKWTGTVVGITGSVGKTTVKEMVADMLSEVGETQRTSGNYNNDIGLPLSMLAAPESARYGVFEIGMNRPGEIGALAHLLQPSIGILTDIGNAHREQFDSLEQIVREKARLVKRVPGSGMVMLDRDSEWYPMIRRLVCARVVTVSMGGVADYVGRAAGECVLNVHGKNYVMPQPGEHIMRNALRAVALGLELGLEPEQIQCGLRRFKAQPMRWQTVEVDCMTFINDAYNANPLSMRANLRTFANLRTPGRKWVVLGGMRELGDTSQTEHEALGEFVDALGFDGVICVGTLGRSIRCSRSESVYYFDEAAEAADLLKSRLHDGDHVLLKASRGEGLEQVLNCFKEL